MRALLLVPVGVIVAAACGVAICGALGMNAHPRELLAAAVTCLIGGMLAFVPILLTRGGDQGAMSLAALVGTAIHLLLCLSGAAIVIIGKVGPGQAYVYWLFLFYMTTLLVLVFAFTKALRAAPPAQATKL